MKAADIFKEQRNSEFGFAFILAQLQKHSIFKFYTFNSSEPNLIEMRVVTNTWAWFGGLDRFGWCE